MSLIHLGKREKNDFLAFDTIIFFDKVSNETVALVSDMPSSRFKVGTLSVSSVIFTILIREYPKDNSLIKPYLW